MVPTSPRDFQRIVGVKLYSASIISEIWSGLCSVMNDILYEKIDHLLTRPIGRPSHQPKVFYESFYFLAKC